MRHRVWLISGLAAVAVFAAACGSSGSSGSSASPSASASPSSPAAAGAASLMITKTSMGTVLTNARGFALYWYAPDSATASKCTGSCAALWPPVTGTPQAAAGVTLSGKLGTITRPDGTMQATYAGHPLYTFAKDTKPGMVTGNGVGGVWHVVTVSGGAAPAPAPSATTGGAGGGGYSY